MPIQHITEYDSDPIWWDHLLYTYIQLTLPSVRAKVNAGDKGYQVMANNALGFLYKDPAKYNLDKVMSGLIQGYSLVWVSEC